MEDLSRIAGQRAVATISKKDISNFKLRKGMPVGTKVTLRGDRMYDFLDRLSQLLCHELVISVELIQKDLTEEETSTWVLKNTSSFQKLILIK